MAKIAIAFFLFALFAVAMAARVVREEPSAAADPLENARAVLNKAIDDLKGLTPEKIQGFISEGIENAKDSLDKINDAVQQKQSKST
ncbi:neuropeptide-like 2 [Drosophila erecta]|nr:neuropeptide-like 2 [Drosophila erecta]